MESQKETKIAFLPHLWRIFALEALLFSLTLGLGTATAFRINKMVDIPQLGLAQFSFWRFIASFLLATLFIFLVSQFVKFKKGKDFIFKTIFILATFSGGATFLSAWLPDALSLILMVFLILWWFKKPSILIHDLLIVMAIAGAGSLLGLALHPLMVVLFLIIFSIYDFIAVFQTKHMIKMAKEMIKSKAIVALVIPPGISGFKERMETVRPGGKFLILGGGDVIFPLLFASSLVPFNILDSVIVAFFSLIGLFASFFLFISQQKRQPIPALPPIALFSLIGFLITLFLK